MALNTRWRNPFFISVHRRNGRCTQAKRNRKFALQPKPNMLKNFGDDLSSVPRAGKYHKNRNRFRSILNKKFSVPFSLSVWHTMHLLHSYEKWMKGLFPGARFKWSEEKKAHAQTPKYSWLKSVHLATLCVRAHATEMLHLLFDQQCHTLVACHFKYWKIGTQRMN